MNDELDFKEDTLKGLVKIAAFLGEDLYRTQRLLTKQVYPAAKIQGRWTASKQRLRQRRDQLLAGEAG